jgi:hypothetical protein
VFFAQRGDFNEWALLTGVFVNSPKFNGTMDSTIPIERRFLTLLERSGSTSRTTEYWLKLKFNDQERWSGTLGRDSQTFSFAIASRKARRGRVHVVEIVKCSGDYVSPEQVYQRLIESGCRQWRTTDPTQGV